MLNLAGDIGLDEDSEETRPAVVDMIISALEAGGPPLVDRRRVPRLHQPLQPPPRNARFSISIA